MNSNSPVTLIILDGWGLAPNENKNAVINSHTPFMDALFTAYPNNELKCYGESVGLPKGQMGNSEVGHLNLGSGRVVYQDISRINKAIEDGSIKQNPAFNAAFDKLRQNDGSLHLLGLVSAGGVHSSMEHLFALIDLAVENKIKNVFIHAFLDGRDTPPTSGADYVAQLLTHIENTPEAKVASVGGRFWGMDRDKRWDRVEKAYSAMIRGQGEKALDPVSYIKSRYAQEEYDEFVTPCVMVNQDQTPKGLIKDNDAIFFFNFRSDRARELTWVFNSSDFNEFDVTDKPKLADYVCMTQYDEHVKAAIAFPPVTLKNTLAQVLSENGLKQLHIAETEKYAHVTFFFNGGLEEPYQGEDRVLIPSPKEVKTYDQKPEMSAYKVTEELVNRINSNIYDFIVVNYANGDMVGHTGNFEAASQAMEDLDICLKKVIPKVLEKGGVVLLTADHGNAEQMLDPTTNGPYTAHTVSNPVPFVLISPKYSKAKVIPGALCDVAPTVLTLLGLNIPDEMTGLPLYEPLMED